MFRAQFHTGELQGERLRLGKEELDLACRGGGTAGSPRGGGGWEAVGSVGVMGAVGGGGEALGSLGAGGYGGHWGNGAMRGSGRGGIRRGGVSGAGWGCIPPVDHHPQNFLLRPPPR